MSKMHVLVVEDEALMAKAICAGLQRLGYRTTVELALHYHEQQRTVGAG